MIFVKISSFFCKKIAGDNRRSMSQDQSQKRGVGCGNSVPQETESTMPSLPRATFNEDMPVLRNIF
jgi:hypothetical protein